MKHTIFDHSFFVKFKAPNQEELTNFILNKEEVYHSFGWAKDCKVNTILCTWQETMELFRPSMNEFANHIEKNFNWIIYDPWINCYKRNGFQEIHDHSTCDFSCVFFPEVCENFSEFNFYDRYGNSLSTNWLKLFGGIQSWNANVQSGDIIFFPGTMLHGVTPHKSDKVRKTLSCNFDFDLSK